MHPPFEDELERYLAGEPVSEAFLAQLNADTTLRNEVSAMEHQARMIRSLRADLASQELEDEVLEPAPGFYARVMERIESQVRPSMWSIFLQPFGQRLAYASMALALVMGAVIMTTDEPVEVMAAAPATILAEEPVVPASMVQHRVDSNNAELNRHAVLAQLVASEQ